MPHIDRKDQSAMKATASALKTRASSAGALLRQWRDIRGKTQLDLSFDAGVSQKHIPRSRRPP
jgi:hypothetical protein